MLASSHWEEEKTVMRGSRSSGQRVPSSQLLESCLDGLQTTRDAQNAYNKALSAVNQSLFPQASTDALLAWGKAKETLLFPAHLHFIRLESEYRERLVAPLKKALAAAMASTGVSLSSSFSSSSSTLSSPACGRTSNMATQLEGLIKLQGEALQSLAPQVRLLFSYSPSSAHGTDDNQYLYRVQGKNASQPTRRSPQEQSAQQYVEQLLAIASACVECMEKLAASVQELCSELGDDNKRPVVDDAAPRAVSSSPTRLQQRSVLNIIARRKEILNAKRVPPLTTSTPASVDSPCSPPRHVEEADTRRVTVYDSPTPPSGASPVEPSQGPSPQPSGSISPASPPHQATVLQLQSPDEDAGSPSPRPYDLLDVDVSPLTDVQSNRRTPSTTPPITTPTGAAAAPQGVSAAVDVVNGQHSRALMEDLMSAVSPYTEAPPDTSNTTNAEASGDDEQLLTTSPVVVNVSDDDTAHSPPPTGDSSVRCGPSTRAPSMLPPLHSQLVEAESRVSPSTSATPGPISLDPPPHFAYTTSSTQRVSASVFAADRSVSPSQSPSPQRDAPLGDHGGNLVVKRSASSERTASVPSDVPHDYRSGSESSIGGTGDDDNCAGVPPASVRAHSRSNSAEGEVNHLQDMLHAKDKLILEMQQRFLQHQTNTEMLDRSSEAPSSARSSCRMDMQHKSSEVASVSGRSSTWCATIPSARRTAVQSPVPTVGHTLTRGEQSSGADVSAVADHGNGRGELESFIVAQLASIEERHSEAIHALYEEIQSLKQQMPQERHASTSSRRRSARRQTTDDNSSSDDSDDDEYDHMGGRSRTSRLQRDNIFLKRRLWAAESALRGAEVGAGAAASSTLRPSPHLSRLLPGSRVEEAAAAHLDSMPPLSVNPGAQGSTHFSSLSRRSSPENGQGGSSHPYLIVSSSTKPSVKDFVHRSKVAPAVSRREHVYRGGKEDEEAEGSLSLLQQRRLELLQLVRKRSGSTYAELPKELRRSGNEEQTPPAQASHGGDSADVTVSPVSTAMVSPPPRASPDSQGPPSSIAVKQVQEVLQHAKDLLQRVRLPSASSVSRLSRTSRGRVDESPSPAGSSGIIVPPLHMSFIGGEDRDDDDDDDAAPPRALTQDDEHEGHGLSPCSALTYSTVKRRAPGVPSSTATSFHSPGTYHDEDEPSEAEEERPPVTIRLHDPLIESQQSRYNNRRSSSRHSSVISGSRTPLRPQAAVQQVTLSPVRPGSSILKRKQASPMPISPKKVSSLQFSQLPSQQRGNLPRTLGNGSTSPLVTSRTKGPSVSYSPFTTRASSSLSRVASSSRVSRSMSGGDHRRRGSSTARSDLLEDLHRQEAILQQQRHEVRAQVDRLLGKRQQAARVLQTEIARANGRAGGVSRGVLATREKLMGLTTKLDAAEKMLQRRGQNIQDSIDRVQQQILGLESNLL